MNENKDTGLPFEVSDSTEMVAVNGAEIAPASAIDALTNPQGAFYCSIPTDGSRAALAAVYNAVNAKGEPLDVHLGEVIQMVNVCVHPVRMVNKETGVIEDGLRTVIIDEQNRHYDAVSQGIVNSLSKIFAIVGKAPYDPPLAIRVVEQRTRNGYKMKTIELV